MTKLRTEHIGNPLPILARYRKLHIMSETWKPISSRDNRCNDPTRMSKTNEDTTPNLSKAKAFMFDLDGTLIKSAVDFIKLKRETIHRLSELGIDTEGLSEKMRSYEIMGRVRDVEAQGKLRLPYSRIVAEVTNIWDRVELETVDRTEKIPGAKAALRILKSRKMGVGVITRGCRAYATGALRVAQLLPFVDVIVGRDDAEEKPSPEPLLQAMAALGVGPRETVMVGDTVEDATCARRARVPFVGVLTGLSDRETLMRMGSVRVLGNVGELPVLLEE